MPTVTIIAEVRDSEHQVILTSDQAGLPGSDTFRVKHEDIVKWVLRGSLGGSTARVKIVDFPTPGEAPHLFREGDAIGAAGNTITGTVHSRAAKGHYVYSFELVGGANPGPLRCLWVPGPGLPPLEIEPAMGGGEQTEPPPR